METAITIREGLLCDLPDILEMEQLCFAEDSFTRTQFIYLMKKGKGAFFVVQTGDKVVAYLSLSFNARTRILRIYSIAVHPDCRGLKIGQRLMDKTIEYATECNAGKITLEVKVSNYPAIGLYEKNGFEATHIKCHYYHDGSNAYYMQRPTLQK